MILQTGASEAGRLSEQEPVWLHLLSATLYIIERRVEKSHKVLVVRCWPAWLTSHCSFVICVE